MAQSWNPAAYADNASFVPALGAGVLEWLAPQAGERILDLGCGDGQLTAKIAAAGAQVTGVDASAAMVDAARGRGIDALVCNAESLSFEAEFDAVFSNAALHWVRNQDAMLVGVRRALRSGGRFVAAVLARHGLAGDSAPVNYYPTPSAYRARLERHGFTVQDIQLIPRPTPLPASGMHAWLWTFRKGVIEALPQDLQSAVVEETVALLEPFLRDEAGNWTADYVRLRFAAQA